MGTRTASVVDFLKSEEFTNIIKTIVKCETDELQKQIDELKTEVVCLRESNIELVNLLTNVNQAGMPLSISKNKNLNVSNKNINDNRTYQLNKNKSETNISTKTKAESSNKKSDGNKTDFISMDKIESNIERENNSLNKGAHTPEEAKWVYPRRKTRRNKNTVIYGKADGDTTFKGVVKYLDYHVYRFPPNFNENDVIEYLSSKNISEVKCEKMQSRYPNQYSSFKVSVSIKQDTDFRNPKIWPQYIVINRFLPKLMEKNKTN